MCLHSCVCRRAAPSQKKMPTTSLGHAALQAAIHMWPITEKNAIIQSGCLRVLILLHSPLSPPLLSSSPNTSPLILFFHCLRPSPTSQVRIPSRQRGVLRQLRDHSCSAWHRHGANAPGLTLHVLYPPLLFQIGARESPHPKGEGRPFSEHNPQLLVGGERRNLSARSTGTHDERLVTMGSCFLDSNKGGNIASRPELPASSLELPEASSTRELGNFRVTPCLLP